MFADEMEEIDRHRAIDRNTMSTFSISVRLHETPAEREAKKMSRIKSRNARAQALSDAFRISILPAK